MIFKYLSKGLNLKRPRIITLLFHINDLFPESLNAFPTALPFGSLLQTIFLKVYLKVLVLLNSKTKAAVGRRNPLDAAFIFRDVVNKYLQPSFNSISIA